MGKHPTLKDFRAVSRLVAAFVCLTSIHALATDRKPDPKLNKIKHIV